jgi:hypothetical protein
MPRAKHTPAPRTAVTAFNALRHGLTSDAPVIPGVESYEEWEAHREAIVAALAPQDAAQAALVDVIASLFWRRQRVARYECAAIDVSRGRVESDFAQLQDRSNEPPSVEEAKLRQEDARRCLGIIETLLDTPPATRLAVPDVEAIFEELATSADRTSESYLDGIEEFERPGDWTVGRLIAVFEALCARDDYAFADMLKQTTGRARNILAGWQLKVARIREEVDRMYQERLLPDAPTLDRIIRYEAHLNRMIYQALNQLEAMQSRSAGAPTPLHRVQAFGLPGG